MNEQLCFENEETVESIISEALNLAREKYGYYKAHVKGYYELKSIAIEKELYNVLDYSQNKDDSISVFIDRGLFLKVNEKKNTLLVKSETFKFLFPNEKYENVVQPEGFVKIDFIKDNFKGLFETILNYTIKSYFPSHKFGCCSKYKECSETGHCLHDDKFYAKGCYYRENLEQGKNFYVKNVT